LSDKEEKLAEQEPSMIARFETQSARFSSNVAFSICYPFLLAYLYQRHIYIERVPLFSAGKISEMYSRNQDLEEVPLLDTLIVLEMNYSLARDCLKAARIVFEHIFPHFFPKTVLPEKFDLIAKYFTGKDDPALAHRQASLKIGVEGTIALVVASGEKVDWAKVAAVRGLNNDKWTALIKGGKSFSKKIISILDPKSTASASIAQTEVK
jgi:hypothetical protein